MTLSRAPPVELMLYEIDIDIYAWRHAVDHTSHSLAMAFAKGGQRKYMSKSVSHLPQSLFADSPLNDNVRSRHRNHRRSRHHSRGSHNRSHRRSCG